MDSSADELLPKLLRNGADPGKGNGVGVASKGWSVGVSARVFGFRLSMKEYAAWRVHSRISKLIFLCLLLGVATILGVITTLRCTVGYLSSTEGGFLMSISDLSPHLEVLSDSSNQQLTSTTGTQPPLLSDAPSIHPGKSEEAQEGSNSLQLGESESDSAPSVLQQLEGHSQEREPSEDAEIRSVTANSTDGEDSFEDKQELPSGNYVSEFALMRYPVNLSTRSDVYHDMSDAELLWRASAGAVHRPRPASVTPKVAYMYLTRGPLPLAPLWERYFKGHGGLYSIYLHAHPRYCPNFPQNSVFYRRNIPSKEVFWGKLSVFAAERRLLANALLDEANERFVLLSESCIPITPLAVAYKYYMKSEHSFVDAYVNVERGGIGRYNRIKHRQKLRPEITPEQWRKGSQWFELSRALAGVVVADRKFYPKYENLLCKHNCICYIDEHYLATVLTILHPSQLANRTSHYIDFHRRTKHPYQWELETITERELQRITTGNNCTYNGKWTQTCHMFARKFSPPTIEPLLKLAATSFGIP